MSDWPELKKTIVVTCETAHIAWLGRSTKHRSLQVSGGTPKVVNERDAPAKANATVNTFANTQGRLTACNNANIPHMLRLLEQYKLIKRGL